MKRKVFYLLLFTLSFAAATNAYAQVSKNLFRIERSKNANIVMYDVRLDVEGVIEKNNTMDAYWMLHADKGQREELSAFDKKAYGYKIKSKGDGTYSLTLKAVEDIMLVKYIDGEVKAELKINDKIAYLSKVYVSSKDGFLGIPKVKYYTLTGTDSETGEEVSQKIEVK